MSKQEAEGSRTAHLGSLPRQVMASSKDKMVTLQVGPTEAHSDMDASRYHTDAMVIACTMEETLPAGTLDWLTYLLVKARHQSLLIGKPDPIRTERAKRAALVMEDMLNGMLGKD